MGARPFLHRIEEYSSLIKLHVSVGSPATQRRSLLVLLIRAVFVVVVAIGVAAATARGWPHQSTQRKECPHAQVKQQARCYTALRAVPHHAEKRQAHSDGNDASSRHAQPGHAVLAHSTRVPWGQREEHRSKREHTKGEPHGERQQRRD